MEVALHDDLIIIARGGKIIRIAADKVRSTGRSAQGVRLVNLEEGDHIAAACVVPDTGSEEDETNGQGVLLQ
jgi:DNA gyrase subunit A